MSYKLNILIVTVLLLVSIAHAAIARAPSPYCTSKNLIKKFPIGTDELLMYDTSEFFSGYNLNLRIGAEKPWASVSQKWNILDRKVQYFPKIISHYVEPKDNTVGRDSFLLYNDFSGATWLSYGIIRNKNSLPEISSSTIVTTDKDVACFDAALFLDHGLAVVDCAKPSGRLFSTYRNYFYIIDLTTHTVKKIVENDLFVSFSKITKRKMMKFSHPQAGGFTYLLRSYFSDSVDEANSDNTYMQIFIVPVEDPTEIQPLRVIDRTFLNVKALRIMDAQIYMDDIFLLDYDTGLYRLDILQSQRVSVTARYRDAGFTRFGVYSDDLQDELIIAVANKHSVFEIDWKNFNKPILINKYSLMANSDVKQVFLNDRYLVVQSTAMGSNATNPQFQIDYTWIFSKGSRTYLNAYHVINHNSSVVQVDFDRENSHIYIADEKGITLREISQARLVMHNMDTKLIGQTEELVLFADSTDFNSNETFRCQEKFTVFFITPENMTIFPTGLDPTDVYSVNYPNPLQISLDPYYIGPNINYAILNHKGDALPDSWINKINKTQIKINPKPVLDTVFFHTDVVAQIGQDLVVYYYQDSANNTHVAECQHFWSSAKMNCDVVRSFNHSSRIRSFTSHYFPDDLGWNYFYIIVFETENKIVHIYDFLRQSLVAEVSYSGDYQAEITSVATSNGFLYVLRKFAKTIDVYSLKKCQEYSTCKPDFSITYATLKGLGIRYFSPVGIVTDREHPEVLFIKCLGSLIILDIDNKQKIHLLDEIISAPTKVNNFNVAISRNRMVIVAYPNLVYEYNMEFIYTYNMVTLTKTLPTYGMTIQPNADIEFSDFDGTVYVNAVDPVKNVSTILIYRCGYGSGHNLYAMIPLDQLYSRPGFEVEVSGFFCNFLTIVTGNKYQVYRVFSQPFMTVQQTSNDFSFKIQAYNTISSQITNEVNVSVVNQIQIITPTKIFNDTKSKLSAEKIGDYNYDDREWFTGNIVHYNYTCEECHKGPDSKVKVREHIDNFQDLHVGGNYYTQTLNGGISVWDDLFRFRPNGSVWQISTLPDQKRLEKCSRVAAAENEIFAVTACQELGRGVNLYVTSFTSYKGFTWGPYFSDAYAVRNLQIVNDVLMLAETPSNPQYLIEQGAIYLYRLSFNAESGDEMDELQVLDGGDFIGANNWKQDKAYFGNAHLTYSGHNNAYRLYITQARYGFFVIDFVRAHASDPDITLLTPNFVDVKKLLQDNNLHLPIDATFQAITFVKPISHPLYDAENIVITTRGYNNFQITVFYDKEGRVQGQILHRVYQRYSFYNAINEVHAKSGFVVVSYVYPANMDQELPYRKQYVTLYDSIDYAHQSDKGYSTHFMIGAIPLNVTTPAMFSINSTYDFHSKGTRSGLVIGLPSNHRLIGASVSHNLTLSLGKGYKSQSIEMKAYNDFSKFDFPIKITAKNDDDDGASESTIVIIIIVLCAIVFVFFLFYIFSIARKKKPTEERESLLTQNQTIGRQSVAQNVSSYNPPSSVSAPSEQMRRQSSSDSSQGEQQQQQDFQQPVRKQQMKASETTDQTSNKLSLNVPAEVQKPITPSPIVQIPKQQERQVLEERLQQPSSVPESKPETTEAVESKAQGQS